jgi:hypothetical protein
MHKLIPQSLKQFTSSLFQTDDKPLSAADSQETDKVMLTSQYITTVRVTTPLGIATSYHLYNQTRSKTLVLLNHKLGLGISYEKMHRQLTAKTVAVMQQIEEE